MFSGILSRNWKRQKFPGVAEPRPDIDSLHQTVLALKEAVEVLTRQRGDVAQSALLVSDFETATSEYTRLVNEEFSQAAKLALSSSGASITADGTYNALSITTPDLDNHNAWATTVYTAPRAGEYLVGFMLHIPELGSPVGATFKPHFRYDINGSKSTPVSTNGSDSQPCLLTATALVQLQKGDTFSFEPMVEHSAQPTTVTADVQAFLAEFL